MTHSKAVKADLAINPRENVAVFASAGTGKTRLLVHRILKLLLNDVDPSHLLAITFTRKAAAEMRERVMQTLAAWAGYDDGRLRLALEELAHPHDADNIAKASRLYEKLLFAKYDIHVTTFHAFCQDILKRFAIHVEVPAGFGIVENTMALTQEARARLYKIAHQGDDPKLVGALFKLLKYCSTVNNVNAILDTFVNSRSDWWSFTEHQPDPVAYASDSLRDYLRATQKAISFTDGNTTLLSALREYRAYLARHATRSNQQYSDLLTRSAELEISTHELIQNVMPVFLIRNGKPRTLTVSKTLKRNLGQHQAASFVHLHQKLCDFILAHLDAGKRQALLALNQAWFYAGHRLLKEYQRLKFAHHNLDFADLEWYTYLLLNKHDNAAWIQYKLDRRIQHVLIDEFQDTNPTQWNLLFPLLQELAANPRQTSKSLFFVGDVKQSIYGFRRANPRLQSTAFEWARQNLDAKLFEMERSFRSSPAIIEFVNRVFSSGEEKPLLDGFRPHKTARTDLWGYVHVDPLIIPAGNVENGTEFRNPLLQKRLNGERNCHYQEGQAIAQHIDRLVASSTPILCQQQVRAIGYRDIVILARNRTNLPPLERALREQNIPYSSVDDNEFSDQLEVQDVIALLTYLIQPHNDLALAQVLRSPCFGISDEDLMRIASYEADGWHEKLMADVTTAPTPLLKQAYAQLQRWRDMANRIPVHDLLDQIYFDINLPARYANCCPPAKKSLVVENLMHFLQLTLDIDAGRYSSIQSFLDSIQKPGAKNSIRHTKSSQNDTDAVQIMTVHAVKGLEAAVIFVMDTGSPPPLQRAYQPVIDWPFNARRPKHFYITSRKANLDQNTQQAIDQQKKVDWKEELNLLYVALTRATQYLFISGVQAKRNQENCWFAVIKRALEDGSQDATAAAWVYRYGTPPEVTAGLPNGLSETMNIAPRLSKPFASTGKQNASAVIPVNTVQADYGILVHKLFEFAEVDLLQEHGTLRLKAESALQRNISAQEFSAALQETSRCLEAAELHEVFARAPGKQILTEVAICFAQRGGTFYRIIDRLIITENMAWIVDFKTSPEVTADNTRQHAMRYQTQISSYFFAVKELYPKKQIRASVLFTSVPAIYDYTSLELTNH